MDLSQMKNIVVIKRDGREQEFSFEKLRKVIYWAADGNDLYVDKILEYLSLKITEKIHVVQMYEELLKTTESLISALQPKYDEIAKKLLLLKIYKETAGVKNKVIDAYPHLKSFLNMGIEYGIYDKKVIETFTDEEIEILNKYIEPKRDHLFNYKGLYIFNKKYCKNYLGKKVELPQITYMVAAMYPFYTEKDSKNKLKYIRMEYDALSTHLITYGTPRISNSLTNNPQLASCVLTTPADDTKSLNDIDGSMALYSKHDGGIAYDVGYIRSTGSDIAGVKNASNGPVPFIKRTEATISAFDQLSKRKGSCVVNFRWWNWDAPEMIMLKDAGGTEDNRARKLVYSMSMNDLLFDRADNDDYITLFDPKDTPLLNTTYGEEFNKAYEEYEKDGSIRKKRIKARELLYSYFKVRKETGNLYGFFTDNVNKLNLRDRMINMSNLCCTHGDTKILTKKGNIPIKELVGQIVECWNGEEWSNTEIVKTNEDIKFYKVKFLNGTETLYTDYHRFIVYTWDNEQNKPSKPIIKTTLELEDGDWVRIINNLDKLDEWNMTIVDSVKKTDIHGPSYCGLEPLRQQIILDNILTKNCEITVPSYPSKHVEEKWQIDSNGIYEIVTTKESGEIGICNLLSINIMKWIELSENAKDIFIMNMLRAADNIMDTQFYPVKEGEISNKKNRPIGIGVSNYAQYLASKECRYDDDQARIITFELFHDIYYRIYKYSMELAKEKGPFSTFKTSEWAKGYTPFHKSIKYFKDNLIQMSPALNHCISDVQKQWDELAKEIKRYGVRFSLHAAIAPTATSSKAINATESIDPVFALSYMEEGSQLVSTVVPNLNKYGKYYQICWDTKAKDVIDLGAIRQIFIDQSQSLTLFYVDCDSVNQLYEDYKYAKNLGIKTIYYMKTPKSAEDLKSCESCSV